MLRYFLTKALPAICVIFLLACEPENLQELSITEGVLNSHSIQAQKKNRGDLRTQKVPETENLRDLILNAVAPSECGATELSSIVWKHFTELASDDFAVENMDFYLFLQWNAVRLRIGTDYYGPNGEFTKYVEKEIRSLEKFWDMHDQIQVLGQHNETLNNREKLADIIWYSMQDLESREDVYWQVDEILFKNKLSPMLPDSPFFAADGFARPNNEIVLGDGIIEMFSETGLDKEIVWTGILTHEWAHQVQFDHFSNWYPSGYFDSRAEETRAIELEADFFSGYYITHKRGGTFNWKRAEQFFELFYQAGDCSFSLDQHHGTPKQRKQASYEGYLLAEAAKKKGLILSAQELHEYFVTEVLSSTVRSLEYL
jgi:hypothetical protein